MRTYVAVTLLSVGTAAVVTSALGLAPVVGLAVSVGSANLAILGVAVLRYRASAADVTDPYPRAISDERPATRGQALSG